MQFTIHNVGHGMCISLIKDKQAILWDCGRKDNYAPSSFLHKMGVKRLEGIVITNYDEDHISDLPNLTKKFNIPLLGRNESISADALYKLKLKSGPISSAMTELIKMIGQHNGNGCNMLDCFPVRQDYLGRHRYYNDYPTDFKDDTNNLSVVEFLRIGNSKIVIPGDLEKIGWEKLLKWPDFKEKLKQGVDIFIASHHGRKSGYCKEVLDLCKPKVVIISDSAIEFDTQKHMASIYGKHASGVSFNGKPGRKVISTRDSGSLNWEL